MTGLPAGCRRSRGALPIAPVGADDVSGANDPLGAGAWARGDAQTNGDGVVVGGVDLEVDEFEAVVDLDAARRVLRVVGEEVDHAGLVDDEVRKL